jgi:hypothetical protein
MEKNEITSRCRYRQWLSDRKIRARIDKWDCMKLKTSAQQRKQLPE